MRESMQENFRKAFGSAVHVLYTNHKGVTALRHIIPGGIRFGATTWHPMPQWLLDCWDIDKNDSRTYALSGIRSWGAPGGDAPGGDAPGGDAPGEQVSG